MNKKIAIITGITGQDGAYLAKFLLEKNYLVIGTYRRSSSVNFWRIEELQIKDHMNLKLVEFDLTDAGSIFRLIEKFNPNEIYNLAAQSFVGVSFEQPITTAEITGIGPVNILEAIRHINKDIKFYQASSSEMFGKVQNTPQDERTSFYPRSPYGVAKLYAHWMTVNYRESYNIFAASGILFNHESPLRGLDFVTRKITNAVAKIKLNKMDCLSLGNLNAQRDWGHAADYVEGMWLMLQAKEADTFVLATNRTETVREFVKLAFKFSGINAEFKGKGLDEVAINLDTNKIILKINPELYRPAEVDLLIGNAEKAKNKLGWSPKKSLEMLCQDMIEADLRRNTEGSSF